MKAFSQPSYASLFDPRIIHILVHSQPEYLHIFESIFGLLGHISFGRQSRRNSNSSLQSQSWISHSLCYSSIFQALKVFPVSPDIYIYIYRPSEISREGMQATLVSSHQTDYEQGSTNQQSILPAISRRQYPVASSPEAALLS